MVCNMLFIMVTLNVKSTIILLVAFKMLSKYKMNSTIENKSLWHSSPNQPIVGGVFYTISSVPMFLSPIK